MVRTTLLATRMRLHVTGVAPATFLEYCSGFKNKIFYLLNVLRW
jgi:hypothetical protein